MPASRSATYEDLCRLPAHQVAEIVHGQLVTHPRPGPRHARAASGLSAEIWRPFDQGSGGPGGWWILDEPELHLGPHVLVPDLAGWRRERSAQLPETAWLDLAPDGVCEVLSRATAQLDRVDKLPLYAQHAVVHAWLLDPIARTLEICALADGRGRLDGAFEEDDAVCAPPFEAVRLRLADLWA